MEFKDAFPAAGNCRMLFSKSHAGWLVSATKLLERCFVFLGTQDAFLICLGVKFDPIDFRPEKVEFLHWKTCFDGAR